MSIDVDGRLLIPVLCSVMPGTNYSDKNKTVGYNQLNLVPIRLFEFWCFGMYTPILLGHEHRYPSMIPLTISQRGSSKKTQVIRTDEKIGNIQLTLVSIRLLGFLLFGVSIDRPRPVVGSAAVLRELDIPREAVSFSHELSTDVHIDVFVVF